MAIGTLLTTEEAARLLGVNASRVHQFVSEQRLKPKTRLGRLLLFERKSVAQLAKVPRPTGRPKKPAKSSARPIAKA